MSEVKFGIRVPDFPIDESRGTIFINQIMNFLEVNEKYFDSAWVSDHFVPWIDSQAYETDTLECFTALSYLSGIFKKLDFGSVVTCNSYRNPALTAKIAATLGTLTNGRFILGIGAGWRREDYVEYGYDFPPTSVRIKQLEEGVQIIRKLLEGEDVTFIGKYFKVEGAHCNPRPDPPPPLMIGGGGEKLTLKIVARYADMWNLSNTDIATYKHKQDLLSKFCLKVGRDPSEIVNTLDCKMAIADHNNTAYKMATENPFVVKVTDAYIVGDHETVKNKIRAFIDIGVRHFIIRFLDFPRLDGAKLFVKKVVPELEQ